MEPHRVDLEFLAKIQRHRLRMSGAGERLVRNPCRGADAAGRSGSSQAIHRASQSAAASRPMLQVAGLLHGDGLSFLSHTRTFQ